MTSFRVGETMNTLAVDNDTNTNSSTDCDVCQRVCHLMVTILEFSKGCSIHVSVEANALHTSLRDHFWNSLDKWELSPCLFRCGCNESIVRRVFIETNRTETCDSNLLERFIFSEVLFDLSDVSFRVDSVDNLNSGIDQFTCLNTCFVCFFDSNSKSNSSST